MSWRKHWRWMKMFCVWSTGNTLNNIDFKLLIGILVNRFLHRTYNHVFWQNIFVHTGIQWCTLEKLITTYFTFNFSPDQRLIAVSLLDNTVKVFFADTLKVCPSSTETLKKYFMLTLWNCCLMMKFIWWLLIITLPLI